MICHCGVQAFRAVNSGHVLIVDSERAVILDHPWLVSLRGRKPNRVRAKVGGAFISLSRLVYSELSAVVDHINGNPCDNRIKNLRGASRAQNAWNSRKKPNTYSRYKGVTLASRLGHWRVTIDVAGKRKYVGEFSNEIAAARAYDSAAIKFHGSFAKTNVALGLLPPESVCGTVATDH